MSPCTTPFRSILYKIPALLVLMLVPAIVGANDSKLEAFDARYKVYRNDQHVADARFRLFQQNDSWLWRMQTKPRGVYRWLTRKKPFSETRTTMTSQGLKLSQLSSGEYLEKPPVESSWFDIDRKTIFYTHSKKNEDKQLALPDTLYSFHDVHRLYSQMKKSGQQQLEIDFYNKGKLFTSKLVLETNVRLPGEGGDRLADRLSQQLENSDKMMVYYYRDHDLAPLRIERIKRGKLKTMMLRNSLQN